MKEGWLQRLSWTAGLCLLLMASAPDTSPAQDTTATADRMIAQVEQAFAEGNARALVEAASDRVEISLFGTSTLYSRSQAMYVLQDFFREHVPASCSIQDLSAAGDSRFLTGGFRHEGSEQPLRLYVRYRVGDGQWTLREIRIEQRE